MSDDTARPLHDFSGLCRCACPPCLTGVCPSSLARSGRQTHSPSPIVNTKLKKASTTPSPTRRLQSSHTTRAASARGSALSTAILLDGSDHTEDEDEEEQEGHRYLPRSASYNNQMRLNDHAEPRSNRKKSSVGATRISSSSSTTPTMTPRRKPERRKKEERKASVRKAAYDDMLSDSDSSDLSEPPAPGEGTSLDSASESESIMAARLQEAGDGESLLGSAASDDEGEGDTEEEERYIIEEAARKEARAQARLQGSNGTSAYHGARNRRQHGAAKGKSSGEEEDENEGNDVDERTRADSGSLSPETLHQLGIDGFEDDLFEAQEPFNSSSEPSFTDFFGSDGHDSDASDAEHNEIVLEPRDDDDELTTDDDDDDDDDDIDVHDADDETDISDLEGGLLSTPFLAHDALAAGAGTQMAPGQEDAGIATAVTAAGLDGASGGVGANNPDIPLLVIEDLDGRLIYARAGDGEAVFGSDGEFEFVDDSDEDDSDEDMDRLANEGIPWSQWRPSGSQGAGVRGPLSDSDEGDTTDELPEDDMPFPRLLVGSVAPHGGRNARRARALAARSRRLSPRIDRSREASAASSSMLLSSQQPHTEADPVQEFDFSISTEDLARDPEGTLRAAAKTLGLSPDDVARLVAGIQDEDDSSTVAGGSAATTPSAEKDVAGQQLSASSSSSAMDIPPVTPDRRLANRPLMGSFMPTSSKSVHRAVIDGSKQAPSPFANRHGTQKRGLANRKRNPDLTTPGSSKRRRRFSQLSGSGTAQESLTGAEEASEGRSSPEPPQIDPMDLDDVLDADMLLRAGFSTSPTGDDTVAAMSSSPSGSKSSKSPVLRASRRGSELSSNGHFSSLNLNAFMRWHKIPMGAFRDGQGAASGPHQPLGTFLLTRGGGSSTGARNGSGGMSSSGPGRAHGMARSASARRQQQEHSPFRGRGGQADLIHLGTAPRMLGSGSKLEETLANGGGEAAEASERAARRDAFFVSPVLWPVRGGGGPGQGKQQGGSQWRTPDAKHWPESQTQASLSQQGSSAQTDGMRRVMTRREKRERKARRRMALRTIDSTPGIDSPAAPSTPQLPNGEALKPTDSPATALPRLSITDASPRHSPAPQDEVPRNDKATTTPASKSVPVPMAAPARGGNKPSRAEEDGQQQQQQQQLSTSASSSSSASSFQHQNLPSSVFGVPLHSPLFGSILQPNNLGFHDDLDERDADGTMTI